MSVVENLRAVVVQRSIGHRQFPPDFTAHSCIMRDHSSQMDIRMDQAEVSFRVFWKVQTNLALAMMVNELSDASATTAADVQGPPPFFPCPYFGCIPIFLSSKRITSVVTCSWATTLSGESGWAQDGSVISPYHCTKGKGCALQVMQQIHTGCSKEAHTECQGTWRQLSTLCRNLLKHSCQITSAKPSPGRVPRSVLTNVLSTSKRPPCRLVQSTHHSFEMWWALEVHPVRWGSAGFQPGQVDRSDMPILFKKQCQAFVSEVGVNRMLTEISDSMLPGYPERGRSTNDQHGSGCVERVSRNEQSVQPGHEAALWTACRWLLCTRRAEFVPSTHLWRHFPNDELSKSDLWFWQRVWSPRLYATTNLPPLCCKGSSAHRADVTTMGQMADAIHGAAIRKSSPGRRSHPSPLPIAACCRCRSTSSSEGMSWMLAGGCWLNSQSALVVTSLPPSNSAKCCLHLWHACSGVVASWSSGRRRVWGLRVHLSCLHVVKALPVVVTNQRVLWGSSAWFEGQELCSASIST